ncbi:MAG: endonuclease/exonuclease/phosphatase [Bacteroidetes bacterium]|nr:endonuclease/exonuclease/phosphatase [Bacteroidota bacterium]
MKWIILCLLLTNMLYAQSRNRKFKICIAAFYNLENFYDTIDNPLVNDDDFTMNGMKRYSGNIYRDKVDRLSKVISEIGTDKSIDGATILGVAEIENDTVLTDLVHHPLLKKRNYQFVHFDSKDLRGIDVALIYNPIYFRVEKSYPIHVKLSFSSNAKLETRDILVVKGNLDGELIYVLVNHWPSKRGGEDLTNASRSSAAAICKSEINRIRQLEPGAKIIVMGDLNDNPDSYSVTKVLESNGDRNKLKPGELYNPWAKIYQQGYGSLANQDRWSLFDQILLSASWLPTEQTGFYFYGQEIFKRLYMIENRGRYKGYPMRTWDGNIYRGGYSDHFPTYIILIKNAYQPD